MKQIKTSELTGKALDYCVAQCEGIRVDLNHEYEGEKLGAWQCGPNHWQPLCRYSSDWSQGGPIIEREKISVWLHENGRDFRAAPNEWMLADPESEEFIDMADSVIGHTPLIAAMRCYVASKLGDVVSVPDELC